jgi:hydrogenase maturation protease
MIMVRVIGVGSFQGDDQAGWKVVEMVRRDLPPGVEAIAIAEPSRLLDYLEGCRKVVVIDSSRSGQPLGTISRLVWPDTALKAFVGETTHGLDVAGVLALAERLARLPPNLVLFGIEGQADKPADQMSDAVRQALPELCRRVLAEVAGPTAEEASQRPEVATGR